MSDKHKKKQITCKDWILWWFSILSAVINLALVAPPLPWRYAKQTPYFGSDFVSDRSVSLLSVTDNFGQIMLWFKLKTVLCQRAREVSAPSIGALIKTVGLGATERLKDATGLGKGIDPGGAVAGCDAWQECKTAANTRCSSYGTVAGLGVGAVLFLVASVISCAVCLIFYSKEDSVKKKKKKVEAEFNTCVASVFAFVFTLFSAVIWCFGSDAVFTSFQSYSYYPYPAASAGYFAVWFTVVLLFFAMLCAWRRQYHPEEDKDGSGGEEPHAQGVQPPPGYGAPPYGAQPYGELPYQAMPPPYGGPGAAPPPGGAIPPPPPPPAPAYADAPPPLQQVDSVPLVAAPPVAGAEGEGGESEHHHHHHHHKHHHKHHDHD